MTTTPTASPELPDLDHLEALARAATPGRWMRLFGERTVYDRMEDGCRGNAIVRADLGYGLQDISNLDFIAGANPAAVLALIATARRNERMFMAACADLGLVNEALGLDPDDGGADPILDAIEELKQARHAHPEGEAPQADLEQLNGGMHDSIFVKVWGDAGGGDAGRRKLADYAYALGKRASISLSPLCGAQHAESGKEADAAEKAAAYDELNRIAELHGFASAAAAIAAARRVPQQATPAPRIIGGQPWSKEAEMTEGWLAAQQAAAPGALELLNADELAALRRFVETCQDGEGYDVAKTMMQRLAAIGAVRRTSGSYYETTDFGMRVLKQAAPSAPGTPEAPSDPLDTALPCDIKVGNGTIRKGCKLRTLVARMESLHRMAMAALPVVTPEQRAEFDSLFPRAAQLDGGQEGSDHA